LREWKRKKKGKKEERKEKILVDEVQEDPQEIG